MHKKLSENPTIKRKWTITRFADQDAYEKGNAYSVSTVDHNLLLNEGINELFTIICSAGGTKFDNSNAHIGVGDSDTAASATQTGLQASTNKLYKAMEASYPTFGTDQKATWRAVFGGDDANFDWREFTVANGDSDAAENLNRLVSDEGTKASGQVWQVDMEISLE